MPTVQRVLVIAGILLIVGFLIQYLYDPFAPYRHQRELDKVQSALNKARKKWGSQNITDYSFDVEYYPHIMEACGAIITVQKGNIVRVVETMRDVDDEGWGKKLSKPETLPTMEWDDEDRSGCHYSHLSIPEIFGIVQHGIDAGGTVIVSFDPKFGFVTEYYAGVYVSRGLLSTHASYAGSTYKFSNFRRLDFSSP